MAGKQLMSHSSTTRRTQTTKKHKEPKQNAPDVNTAGSHSHPPALQLPHHHGRDGHRLGRRAVTQAPNRLAGQGLRWPPTARLRIHHKGSLGPGVAGQELQETQQACACVCISVQFIGWLGDQAK